MVKVEWRLLRYLEEEDFRCLVALEMCMRNHEVAPTVLIERIAQLAHGGARKHLNHLLKFKVIHHENLHYDGFCMKYAAYDFLAARTFIKRGSIQGIGSRIGCGKESDILNIIDPNGHEQVMKLQRLGRCSFRSVARNRDYKGHGKARRGESWFYLSRLAATKEFAFMKLLYDEGFPVPKPIDHNRHAVVMERVDGYLLNNVSTLGDMAQKVYERILNLMVKLAQHGLIHGDFNEFNTFVTKDFKIVIIDFPQMVSTDHPNASDLFDRDVKNLANFFKRRFRIEKMYYPSLETDVERSAKLDQKVAASGAFTKQQQKDLELLMTREAEEAAAAEAEESDDEADEADPMDTIDETVDAEEAEQIHARAGDEPAAPAAAGPAAPAAAAEGDADDAPALVPASTSKRRGKGKGAAHADPTVPTVAALAARAAAAAAAKPAKPPASPEGDGDEEVDDGAASDADSAGAAAAAEEESVAPSIASTAATLAKRILQKKRAENPNYRGEDVDSAHVWDRVKARGRHNDNVAFGRQVHRNAMKGKHKRRVAREISNGEHPTTIYDV